LYPGVIDERELQGALILGRRQLARGETAQRTIYRCCTPAPVRRCRVQTFSMGKRERFW